MRGYLFVIPAILCAANPPRLTAQSKKPVENAGRPTRWDAWDPADSIGDIVVPVPGIPGLAQHIRIQPRTPRQGDTVYIASRLEYSGKDSINLTTHICGFALRADQRWLQYVGGLECGGYSKTSWWSKGSNDLNAAVYLVTGKPGTHRAFITDLLSPAFAAPFDVTVRPPRRLQER